MARCDQTNPMDVAIGDAVKARREESLKSVEQAAAEIGVSPSIYYQCEAGMMPFQARDLLRLADVFGVSTRDLMPSSDRLVGVDARTQFGGPEEIHDLIHFFSGVVSPAMRGFFLQQIKDASIKKAPKQERAEAHARKSANKDQSVFSKLTFLRAAPTRGAT